MNLMKYYFPLLFWATSATWVFQSFKRLEFCIEIYIKIYVFQFSIFESVYCWRFFFAFYLNIIHESFLDIKICVFFDIDCCISINFGYFGWRLPGDVEKSFFCFDSSSSEGAFDFCMRNSKPWSTNFHHSNRLPKKVRWKRILIRLQ